MTNREIREAIRLTGLFRNYQVHHDIPGEAIVCHVPSTDIGDVIVRALRARAYAKKGLMPDGSRYVGHGQFVAEVE